MKQKKFLKKVQRYLELSKEFQAKESDLFSVDAEDGAMDTVTITECYSGTYYCEQVVKSRTRSEVIIDNAKIEMEVAKQEAKKADRYDEYIKLRKDLGDICQILLKI